MGQQVTNALVALRELGTPDEIRALTVDRVWAGYTAARKCSHSSATEFFRVRKCATGS